MLGSAALKGDIVLGRGRNFDVIFVSGWSNTKVAGGRIGVYGSLRLPSLGGKP